MDFFKELSDMKFGEAYNELATIAFEEGKDLFNRQKEELQKTGNPSDVVEQVKDRLMFG